MSCHAHALAESRKLLCAEDVDLIRAAVRMLLPKDNREVQVADLGAGSGTTALSVFAERSTNIRVLTVDHDPVSLASTEECMTNAGYRHLWTPLLSRTDHLAGALALLPVPRIDFLMVDASHEYEDVKHDLETWLTVLPQGSPVWCHDYTDLYPGSVRAIDEAVAGGLLTPLSKSGWGWLGLARKGNRTQTGERS